MPHGDERDEVDVPPDMPAFGSPVSQGLSGGTLQHKVMPVYPLAAIPLRLGGTVLLDTTIDEKGNVYLTGRGVTVFDKAGKKIAHIDVPEGWTANVCFGGSDMKTLFITASTRLYGLKMNVKGVGSQ